MHVNTRIFEIMDYRKNYLRRNYALFSAAAVTLFMVSCSSEDFLDQEENIPAEELQEQQEGPTVTIPAYEMVYMNGQSSNTRLIIGFGETQNQWTEGDKFGVYYQDENIAANAAYTIMKGGTNVSPYTNDAFSMKPNSTYYAYYPHNINGIVTACPVDMRGQVELASGDLSKLVDYHYMNQKFVTDEDGKASFTFNKLTSLLVFQITAPSRGVYTAVNFKATEGKANFIQTGTIDFTTGNITPEITNDTHTVKLGENGIALEKGQTITVYSMILPQDFSQEHFNLELETRDGVFVNPSPLPGINFVAGKGYSYVANYQAVETVTLNEFSVYNLTANGMELGHYSGIAKVGDDEYIVIDDQQNGHGLTHFKIGINSASGQVAAAYKYAVNDNEPKIKHFGEAVTFNPKTNTLWAAYEGDQIIKEYSLMKDTRTGNYVAEATNRQLSIPSIFGTSFFEQRNGFDALTYSPNTGLYWATTDIPAKGDPERTLRVQSFTTDLQPAEQYLYVVDEPAQSSIITMQNNVSAMLALEDGRLIVVENEAYLTATYDVDIINKLYLVDPFKTAANGTLQKTELLRIQTDSDNQAVYEGICFGPKLDNGKQTILLLTDSNGGRNYLNKTTNDYIKVLTIE